MVPIPKGLCCPSVVLPPTLPSLHCPRGAPCPEGHTDVYSTCAGKMLPGVRDIWRQRGNVLGVKHPVLPAGLPCALCPGHCCSHTQCCCCCMRDMEQRGGGSGRSIIPGLTGWDMSSSVHVYTCECMCRYVMGCLGLQPPPSELCLSASTTAQDPTPASVPTLCKDVGDCISAGALPGRVGHEHLSELVLLGFPIGSRFPAAFSP